MKKLLGLLLCAVIAGCSPETKTVIKKEKADAQSSGSGSSSGSTTGLSGSTTGGTTGTTGGGGSLLSVELAMGGGDNWLPGLSESGKDLSVGDFLTVFEMKEMMASDATLKVRFKLKEQPQPTVGKEYCYGRATGMSPDYYKYDSVKLTVWLRDVISCSGTSCTYGARYNPRTVAMFDVDENSEVIDLSNIRNPSPLGHVIEVGDVQSDSKCQFSPGSSSYCPSTIVHSGMCWHVKMDIATDWTVEL